MTVYALYYRIKVTKTAITNMYVPLARNIYKMLIHQHSVTNFKAGTVLT